MLKKGSFMAILAVLGVSLFFCLCQPAACESIFLTPEAGQVLIAGDIVDVSWEKRQYPLNTSLNYTYDHNPMIFISHDTQSADEIIHYYWKVPDITSDHCRLVLYGTGVDLIGNEYASYLESEEFKIHQALTVGPLIFQAFTFIIAPADLAVEDTGSDHITLSWEDKSTNEDGFIIERKTGSQDYSEIASLPAGRESYNDDSVAPGTAYSYRIKAFNSSTSSSFSNEVSATTGDEAAAPAEPVGPSAGVAGGIEMKFYIGSTEYYVNGRLMTMDTAPLLFEGRTILPIRYVADALGAQVSWEAQARKVTVTGVKTIELTIDSPVAKVDGALAFIDPNNERVTPVIMPPGRTMLPLRFTAETLGCTVEWKAETQEITLRYVQD
jgi:hypothetical protein